MFEGIDPGSASFLATHPASSGLELAVISSSESANAAQTLSTGVVPDLSFLSSQQMNDILESPRNLGDSQASYYYGSTIIVAGFRWSGGGSGGGGGGDGWDTNTSGDDHYGDSGSSNPDYVQTLNHHESCGTDDGAAVQITNTIKLTSGVYGPMNYNWKEHEYSALVGVRWDGSFGAVDQMIFTKGLAASSSVPKPDGADFVAGLIHNHPDILGDAGEDLQQRYPSPRDWEALEVLHGIFSPTNPGYDPSLWLLDARGVLREFKLTEKGYFDGLDVPDRAAGVGLDGRERSASCGN
jgi:hypothetical protein